MAETNATLSTTSLASCCPGPLSTASLASCCPGPLSTASLAFCYWYPGTPRLSSRLRFAAFVALFLFGGYCCWWWWCCCCCCCCCQPVAAFVVGKESSSGDGCRGALGPMIGRAVDDNVCQSLFAANGYFYAKMYD